MEDLDTAQFDSLDAWERWLDENHAASAGVWLKLAKKGSGATSVTRAEALDAALCYGWIDGQGRALDDRFYLQRFTPRRPRSIWSKINRDRATALIEAGRMRPAGLRQVQLAQADGRWEAAYDGQRSATVPDDLQARLDGTPAAAAFFATLSRQNRYAILFRIQTAKRPETRARRIEQFVAMLERGETLYP